MTGTGTALDPYIITTRADLEAVNDHLDAYYELGADIDLTGVNWLPLGLDASTYNLAARFWGQFDGKGHKITGMTISSEKGYLGLFAFIDNEGYGAYGYPACVKNVILCNASITVTGTGTAIRNYIGLLAGYVYRSTGISGCQATGTITNASAGVLNNVGGLVGIFAAADTGSVDACSGKLTFVATGSAVYAGGYVGGLIGRILSIKPVTNSLGSLTCIASTGILSYAGGLVGSMAYKGNISYCTGCVSINAHVGNCAGLVGYLYNQTLIAASVHHCRAMGSIVSGSGSLIGGAFGTVSFATIHDILVDVNCSGTEYIGGFIALTFGSTNTPVFVTDCAALGDATASLERYCGGFVGQDGFVPDEEYYLHDPDHNVYTNCYSIGQVTHNAENDGGFSSYDGITTVSCYWDTESSGCATSGMGVGKTTAEMQTQSTFTGWDFSTVWNIASGTYPFLRTAFVTIRDWCKKAASNAVWYMGI